jgi:signal-transduction protein with cAMP-binding, CBS, and nucleotidyltransferase domain
VARVFSVIEDGEVEILEATEENPEAKIVAVLGKGDFFGEAALLESRSHEASARARTPVRLRQVGSALFSETAANFPPFRELLSNAVMRRSGDLWRRLPLGKSILDREPLASFLEPLPTDILSKSSTLLDAIRVLRESPSGEVLILDEEQHLWGTLDRSDLFQIVARIAVTPAQEQEALIQHKLSEFVQGNPLSVALSDSTAVASATMLVRGITWLPVVQSKDEPRPVGTVRGERIANRVIQAIARTEADHARAAT